MPDERLHFTLGPAQEFVGQARRTRDLWAGSFLLSYLAARAIEGMEGDSRVVFPDTSHDLLVTWLEDCAAAEHVPAFATLPNRFTVEGVDLEARAQEASHAVREAWLELADAVWQELVAALGEAFMGPDVRAIWERQVAAQWPLMWVVGSDPTALEQRKNLRSFRSAAEPGEKCTQCGYRQSLSPSPEAGRRAVVEFWASLSDGVSRSGNIGRREFKANGRERLCAVCTIKRLFPLVARDVLGWQVEVGYPSTDFLAAVPALRQLLKKAHGNADLSDQLKRFTAVCKEAGVAQTEDGLSMPALAELLQGLPDALAVLVSLDGSVWHESALERELEEGEAIGQRAEPILAQLRDIKRRSGVHVPSFYCLLAMDGDHMGEILARHRGNEHVVSSSLDEFAQTVIALQDTPGFAGRVVYAGGDDVLMLLPVTDGLHWAAYLREAYCDSFRGRGVDARISAGIQYAHYSTPLQAVIRDAHRLLNDIAKDAMDRDSFAIRVWHRGGPALTFGRRWKSSSHLNPECEVNWIARIEELIEDTRSGVYSSSFLHRIPRLLGEIGGLEDSSVLTDDEQAELLTMEYLRERLPAEKHSREKEANIRVRRLLDLLIWPQELSGQLSQRSRRLTGDGALVVRFLAQEGGSGNDDSTVAD